MAQILYKFIKTAIYPIELPDLLFISNENFKNFEFNLTIEWLLNNIATEQPSDYLEHQIFISIEKKLKRI